MLFCHFNKEGRNWPHSKFLKTFLCFIKTFLVLFRDASTYWSYMYGLGSLGVYQEAVYFYCCVIYVSLLSLLI